MIRTVVKFVGLPIVVASAAVAFSAAAASAQRTDIAPPRTDIDVVTGQCVLKTAGYSQFQACVIAALEA